MAVIGSRQLRHFIGSRNTGKVYVVSRSRGVLSSGVKRIRQISCSSAGLAAGDPPPSSGSGRTQEKPQSIPQSSASPPSSSNSGSFNASNHESPITSASSGFQLSIVHVALFTTIFVCGAFFATLTLQLSANVEFGTAIVFLIKQTMKSAAFRQLISLGMAILIVRFGLNNVLKALAGMSKSPIQWDKSKLYYVLREVYQPLELLLLIAALCLIADTFMPSLISVTRETVSHMVKTIMSTSFIAAFSSVVFNLKSRFLKEKAWESEMKGDLTQQRRWEAYDKLGAFVIYVLTFVLGIQAMGLDVTSVLAIGGIGGLAIGLAGREICENLLNGFLIMSTTPFEVGDEIHFFHSNKQVEGNVIDIGWYRTQVRSFEREVYVIPNSIFSKNIVLNISRRAKEYRFREDLCIRVQDVDKANAIIQDIRRIVKNDSRIINKLHRRIFLDTITLTECKIYISFYLEAANRDSFLAMKQDMLLAFVDVVERNKAKLSTPRTMVEMEKEVAEAIGSFNSYNPVLAGLAAVQTMAQAQQNMNRNQMLLPDTTTTTIPAEVLVSGSGSNSIKATSVSSTPQDLTIASISPVAVPTSAAAVASPSGGVSVNAVVATPATSNSPSEGLDSAVPLASQASQHPIKSSMTGATIPMQPPPQQQAPAPPSTAPAAVPSGESSAPDTSRSPSSSAAPPSTPSPTADALQTPSSGPAPNIAQAAPKPPPPPSNVIPMSTSPIAVPVSAPTTPVAVSAAVLPMSTSPVAVPMTNRAKGIVGGGEGVTAAASASAIISQE